jgi:hypothetical protein
VKLWNHSAGEAGENFGITQPERLVKLWNHSAGEAGENRTRTVYKLFKIHCGAKQN